MKHLHLTTCLAENTVPVAKRLAQYLAQALEIPVRFGDDVPYRDRFALIDAGDIALSWMCGLPYVTRADAASPPVTLLAAPVMQAERYGQRPYYFSDVVVRRDSPFRRFADLRGATWAYNENGSHSGCNVTRWHLAQMGETAAFFGRRIASGSHHNSLDMALAGEVDASAIDSTLLDWLLAQRPALREQIRIIESLGPSPMPPFVIHTNVPPALAQEVKSALLHLHESAVGQAILHQGLMSHFQPVQDADYDPIRHMARQASAVKWT